MASDDPQGRFSRPTAEILKPLGRFIEEHPAGIEQFIWFLDYANLTATTPGLADEAGPLVRVLGRMQPDNWRGLTVGQLSRVEVLIRKSGLCLSWVPRSEVIVKLIGARSKLARDQALEESAEWILSDIERCLAACSRYEVSSAVRGVQQAVTAYRAGAYWPAQAACVPVLTELVETHFKNASNAREELREFDARPPDPRALRARLVLYPLYCAIEQSWNAEQGRFNRHRSAHGGDPAQFSPANAIAAMLLATGAIRETNETYCERDLGVPYFSTPLADGISRTSARRAG